VSNPGMHATGRPATQDTPHHQPRPNLAVRADRAYSSLPTCSPAPSVIADSAVANY